MADTTGTQALWTLFANRFNVEGNSFEINGIAFEVEVERAYAEKYEELLLRMLAAGQFPRKVLDRFYPPDDEPDEGEGHVGTKLFFSVLDAFLSATGRNVEVYQHAKDLMFDLVQVKLPGSERHHLLPEVRHELNSKLHTLEFTFLFLHVAVCVYRPFFTSYGPDINLLYQLGLLLFAQDSPAA